MEAAMETRGCGVEDMLRCAVCGGSRAVPKKTEQVVPYNENPSCALLVKGKLFIIP